MGRYAVAYRSGAVAAPTPVPSPQPGGLSLPRPAVTPQITDISKRFISPFERYGTRFLEGAKVPVGQIGVRTIPLWFRFAGRAVPLLAYAIALYDLYDLWKRANRHPRMVGWSFVTCSSPGVGPYSQTSLCGQLMTQNFGGIPGWTPITPGYTGTTATWADEWHAGRGPSFGELIGVEYAHTSARMTRGTVTPDFSIQTRTSPTQIPNKWPLEIPVLRPDLWQAVDPFTLPINVPWYAPAPLPYPLVPYRPWYAPERAPNEQPQRGPMRQPAPGPRIYPAPAPVPEVPYVMPSVPRAPGIPPGIHPGPRPQPIPDPSPAGWPWEEVVPGQWGPRFETNGTRQRLSRPSPDQQRNARPSRPRPGDKERKMRASYSSVGMVRLGGMGTEIVDAIQALWDAIPTRQCDFPQDQNCSFNVSDCKGAKIKYAQPKTKKPRYWYKDSAGKWQSRTPLNNKGHAISHPHPQQMLRDLYNHFGDMDLCSAANNLIHNFLEDYSIGKTSQKANEAYFKASKRLGSKPPVGLGTGPAM